MTTSKSKNTDKYFAYFFGVVFITSILVLAILIPEPKPYQETIFRIVIALSCAGVAAMIPGLLEISVSKWIRASGALAVFVLVFLYNPASVITNKNKQSVNKEVMDSQR